MSDPVLKNLEGKRAQLSSDGYVIVRNVVPPEMLDRLRRDVDTIVARERAADPHWATTAQPRGSIGDRVDEQTIGAFEFVLHKNTHGLSAKLLECPESMVSCTNAQTELSRRWLPGTPAGAAMPEPVIELSESRIIYSTADLEADFPDFQPEPGKLDPPEADRGVTPIGPMHMHGLLDLPNGDLVVFFTADDDHWFRRVCGIRSRDRGETWKIDPEGETFASSAWCVLDDGTVYLLGHERTPSW